MVIVPKNNYKFVISILFLHYNAQPAFHPYHHQHRQRQDILGEGWELVCSGGDWWVGVGLMSVVTSIKDGAC